MGSINTSKARYIFEYQKRDLEYLLNTLNSCYLMIASSGVSVINNENAIRDIFLSDEYLENHQVKEKLNVVEFQFDKEIQTTDGRVDIRIFSMIEKMSGRNKPYYFIECKRIDGTKTYNDFYCDNGIKRFIDEKYPTYNDENAMIGFVVNKIDIEENSVKKIKLKKYQMNGIQYSYLTKHNIAISGKEFNLYHLMFDFSGIVSKN